MASAPSLLLQALCVMVVVLPAFHARRCKVIDYSFTFDGKSYLVTGTRYFEVDSQGKEIGKGKIGNLFKNVPTGVQAATWWPGRNKLFFFKDTQYYTATKGDRTVRGPFESNELGEMFVRPIQAATNFDEKYTYIMRDCLLYQFEGTRLLGRTTCGRSIPAQPDAAIQHKDRLVFIENDRTWSLTRYGYTASKDDPIADQFTLTSIRLCKKKRT